LEALSYAVLHGPDITADMFGDEHSGPSYRDMVLEGRLCQALVRLNPDLPLATLRDALQPMLITGALRVAIVERVARAAL
jgi:type I restriction enzyme R subunit